MDQPAINVDRQPFIVIWETTRACDLACVHCRAAAQPDPLPGELTHAEAIDLIDQVADLGAPILVLSGGDPLKRPRLTDLIRHGKRRGLRVGTIPAATPRLTLAAVQSLKEAGLDQMALSLDFATADEHDRFRGVRGAFDKVMEAAEWAHQSQLPLQINTVLSAQNGHDVDALIALVTRLGIVFWEVFFLVPVGRGRVVPGLTATQYEAIFAKLYELERTAPFIVKVTEALHYRRYRLQRQLEEQRHGRQEAAQSSSGRHGQGPGRPIGLSRDTINAGKGHCFISATGEVYPSGFLPLPVGDIRRQRLAALYQTSPVFRELRNPALLKGRCGGCEFRMLCGGSRARAYAVTGDYLAEDPCCAHLPNAFIDARRDRSGPAADVGTGRPGIPWTGYAI
jgi:radical SAM protein